MRERDEAMFEVPLIIRGEVIDQYTVKHADRSGAGNSFVTPDIRRYVDELVLRDPRQLEDLYTVSLDGIYDFLEELGVRLDLDRNPHWRQAFEVSCRTSNLSRPVLEHIYRTCPSEFRREIVSEVVETRIGSQYLEGWAPKQLCTGREIRVRAMGARSIHIIAGNIPIVATLTAMRSAITRNDAIIKLPSNDPLTAVAIARTMIEMAPDHPITRHFSVGYWKGGDAEVESKIYHPANIEKLVAWGGFASIKHIAKYLQPGIDLITLDPKNSTTLIGHEAFADETTMREVARRAAADMGSLDQEACSNARVMFVESGTDSVGVERANRLGAMIFEELHRLPPETSSGPNRFDATLLGEIESILDMDGFYRIYADPRRIPRSGAVIVSQMGEQVDFAQLLYGRVGNLVPVDDIEHCLSYFTTATQTVGIFPESLKLKLRGRAVLAGAQMIVPLGYATTASLAAPQDGIEPERRMCRWVVENVCDPAVVPGPWMHESPILTPESLEIVPSP
jgi:hypothetical protein